MSSTINDSQVINSITLCASFRLFGDDCIIQWTREGKRGAPLLCRTKAYTTLTITADEAAAYVRRLNRKLPAPSNTKRAVLPTPHEFEPQAVPKNVVLVDPLRAQPLPRPLSIAPLLPEGSSVVQRNVDMTTTTAKMPASDTHKITRDHPPQRREMNTSHIRQLREQNHPATTAITPHLATRKIIPGKSPAGSKIRALLSSPSDPRIQKTPLKIGSTRKRNATQLEVLPRIPDTFTPLVAKSKKDITSNVLKMNHSQPPYPAATTPPVHVPIPPPKINQKPIKPQRRSIGSKKSPIMEAPLVPPPPKVQIIDQTMVKPAVAPSNGSILYSHLQRKIPPKSLPVSTPINGASNKRPDSEVAGIDEKVVAVQSLSQSRVEETQIIEEQPMESPISGTRIEAGTEGEHEEILMEDGEEVVVDLSDDKIIYELNDSAEIIEEDDGGEFIDEVYGELIL